MKDFFKNEDMLIIVDALAKRYGKTPYEVLTQMTLAEFNFNVAVMIGADKALNKGTKQQEIKAMGSKPSDQTNWGSFGIKRTVKKKEEIKNG